jgi:extracellular elastinolytic metalloproteinase
VRSGVVPAFESLVFKGEASAYRVITDARSAALLARHNVMENLASNAQAIETNPFSGEVPAVEAACGPDHPFTVGAGVRYLDGFAAATQPLNDVVFLLIKDGVTLISADSNFSPERFHYEPAGGVPPGDYVVRVCDFDDSGNVVWSEPRTYTGRVIADDTLPPSPYLARWKVFPSNPLLGPGGADPWSRPSTDIRELYCWTGAEGCDEAVDNLAARYPWDHDPVTDTPTFTTVGNNAVTAESWTHPTAPSPFQFRPVSLTRDYVFPWTDSWNTTDCNTGNPSGSGLRAGRLVRRLGGGHESVREPQPHARLVVLPRLHRGELERSAAQLRPDRAVPAERPGHGQHAGRRGDPDSGRVQPERGLA